MMTVKMVDDSAPKSCRRDGFSRSSDEHLKTAKAIAVQEISCAVADDLRTV